MSPNEKISRMLYRNSYSSVLHCREYGLHKSVGGIREDFKYKKYEKVRFLYQLDV